MFTDVLVWQIGLKNLYQHLICFNLGETETIIFFYFLVFSYFSETDISIPSASLHNVKQVCINLKR